MIHPLCNESQIELRCILLPLIILELFLQLHWSSAMVNSIDLTLFGKAHTCLYKVPQLTVHARAKTKPTQIQMYLSHAPKTTAVDLTVKVLLTSP